MSIDLSTKYLGLKLKNPLVAAASPLTRSVADIKRLESAGIAAVVLQSLFAEQIEHEEFELLRLHEFTHDSFPESSGFLPEMQQYNAGPEAYLEHLQDVKQQTSVPVIASLNGSVAGNWLRYARLMELAGADALELNVYFVSTSIMMTSSDVERQYLEMVRQLSKQLTIPFAVKLGPYFSSLPNFATALVQAGASGLVLFNRYLDPEINLETLRVEPHLQLSSPHENRLVVRWLGILRDHVHCSLAASGGIHSIDEVLKSLLAGANVTMLASHLLTHGIEEPLAKLLEQLTQWLKSREYTSVQQLIGSVSRRHCADSGAYERGNYMKALVRYTHP